MKKVKHTVSPIKIGRVFAQFYKPLLTPKKMRGAVISLGGAPGFGDNGKSKEGEIAAIHGYALIRPDYIGHCRSDGTFSFENCVRTFYPCYEFLKGKRKALNLETNLFIKVNPYNNVILFANSFGGSIAPFVKKYKSPDIKSVGLVAPVIDWKSLYKNKKKIVEHFENKITREMGNIYRGYRKPDWTKIITGKQKEFNPIENLNYLNGFEIHIFHGNKDRQIPWKDVYGYYQKIKSKYPSTRIYWKLMQNHKHSPSVVHKSLDLFLSSLNKRGSNHV
jgi:pimeloyl-ACP methyl ester carboxylesterase